MRVHMTHPAPKRPMSLAAKLGIGCGAFALAVVLAIMLLVAAALQVPPTPKPPQPASPAPRARVDAAARQVSLLEEGARRGVPVEQAVTVRQEDLNAVLAARDPEYPLPPDVESVNLQFTNDIVRVSGVGRWQGRRVYVEVDARPTVGPDGRVQVTLEGGRLGRLPLPANIRRQIQDRINQELQKNLGEQSIVIESVTAQDGALTVVARTVVTGAR
jgi:flagellar basal body-associated protein FliL